MLHQPKALGLHAQTIYAELLASCAKPLFEGQNIFFTAKKIRDKTYWYTNLKIGKTAIQRYLGPDDEATQKLIAHEKSLWEQAKESKAERARLVDMYLAAGGMGLSATEGQILNLLSRSGVFLCGGVLVGTPAFRALGNNLGVQWADDFQTRDVDLAADHRYPLALPNQDVDVKKTLLESGLGVIEVPALNPKHPSTTFKVRGKEYLIDILAPGLGKPASEPVFLSHFNTYATPLRYLDYLLEEREPAVLPYGAGIVVNVPAPARFAIHKLVISQRRHTGQLVKSKKDLSQATQILQVLFEVRPGAVIDAYEQAEKMGSKFIKQLNMAIKLLDSEMQALWREWV